MMNSNTMLFMMIVVGVLAQHETRTGVCKEVANTVALGMVDEKCQITGQVLFVIMSPSNDLIFASTINITGGCDDYGWVFGKKEGVECTFININGTMIVTKNQAMIAVWDTWDPSIFLWMWSWCLYLSECMIVVCYYLVITLPTNMYASAWQHFEWVLGALLVVLVVGFYKLRPTYKGMKALHVADPSIDNHVDEQHTSIQSTNHNELPPALEWDATGKPLHVKKDT